ncbi:prepilin-type N-terminal cleavage/methylation domain-containing protein [Desulfosporosinus acidiphilus]|uniref:prepilin-type N-terminal cleavage/methylation domain-containing protein n=1 Tax=Desulfosporosinus acidiphilus TaxID=885581 RepID=UPI003D00BF02
MRREDGFTLLEVLTALLIAGIFLISALNLLTELWGGNSSLNESIRGSICSYDCR